MFVSRRMRAGIALIAFAGALAFAIPTSAQMCAGPFAVDPEWGDAPEGTLAYPDLPVAGLFPTCFGGPSGCIQHAFVMGGVANNAFFGPNLDYERDGNGGVCPPPQYENDECAGLVDGDAGLVLPTAFTFGPTGPPFTAITCSGQAPQSLATTCGTAAWGTDIDILITNNLFLDLAVPVPTTMFFNVLIDFNRSGTWDQLVPTGCGQAIDEHVVKNVLVPPGFSGLASQLLGGPADFAVGSDSGYVWVRFTLSPEPNPIPIPWDGSGFWEGGETEDYMLHIRGGNAPAEYGDAPEDVVAYPPFPIQGRFPTCVQTPGFVQHPAVGSVYFGSAVDFEFDGNADDCAFNIFDNDECFGGEAGLVVPRPYTIQRTMPGFAIVPCAPPASDIGTECSSIVWGAGLDLQITNNLHADAYFNMLADWDQDGDWGGSPAPCGPTARGGEHVVRNLVVPAGFSGLLSQLSPPNRQLGGDGYVWMRFTVSTVQAPADWDGSGNMGEGETEDYLMHIAQDDATDTQETRLGVRVGEASPSPTFAGTRVDLDLPAGTDVAAEIYDAKGRKLRDLGAQSVVRGAHRLLWDGLDAAGKRPAAGVYFVHVRVGTQSFTRRVLLLN